MKRLLLVASVAAALVLPAASSAGIAKSGQFEGTIRPDTCGATQWVNVDGRSTITALFAGTNAGGYLFGQVLSTSGRVLSSTGSYNTTGGGTYGVRACFMSGDGIDTDAVRYVGMVATSPR
jgi:hypothetical protein